MILFFAEQLHQKDTRRDRQIEKIRKSRETISPKEKSQNLILPLKISVANDYRIFQGGCLKQYLHVWSNLGAPKQICELLNGVRIPFMLKPPLIFPNSLAMQNYRTKISPGMTYQIQSMLESGILESAEQSPSYLSTFFLVPKPDGTQRPIFNLKQLNKFVVTKPFQLFNHFRVPTFLQHQDWMAKMDLSQAYFHIPIAQQHRRFLRLCYHHDLNRNQLLQMTCLPFGLASAPRTFATVTNWIAELLRSRGIRCVVYLDDFLLANQSMHKLRDDIALTVNIMQKLGWAINFEKSVLNPTQCLEFLGITWDTKRNAMSLSESKCLSLRKALHEQLTSGKWSLKQYQRLMGRLNFANFVTKRGRLHCRTLQFFSRQLSKSHPYRKVTIPQPVQIDIKWWINAIGARMPIHMNAVTHLLTTDASNIGWGAQINDHFIMGTWKKTQMSWHANRKEMFAVYAAVLHEQNHLHDAQILLQTDNRTVVSYINKEGGTKSKKLLKQTRQLLSVLDTLNVHLLAQYFPGRFNAEVDALSRQKRCPEWHLTAEATSIIFLMWGTPEMDLFASKTAHVIQRYVSMDVQDHQAQHHNAFCHQWHYELAWLFPPPNLIPRVLSHLNQASGRYILIAPKWNKVFWRADVQRRALRPPYPIPDLARNLIDTRTGVHPPEIQDLHLEAWLISGGKIC